MGVRISDRATLYGCAASLPARSCGHPQAGEKLRHSFRRDGGGLSHVLRATTGCDPRTVQACPDDYGELREW